MEVRWFRMDERQELMEAIHRLWRQNHIYVRDESVFNHLFLDTPYRENFSGNGQYSFLGLWDEDRIVGLMGVIPQEMNLMGQRLPSMTSSIWIIDKSGNPDVNGYDLYDYIFSEHEEVRMWVALGLSDIAYKIDQRLGWKMIDNLPRWIVVNHPKKVTELLLPGDDAAYLLPRLEEVPAPVAGLCVGLDSFDAEKWDRFYWKKFAPCTIGTCRDSRFLTWRYLQSPVLKYHFVTIASRDGECCGLAVFRIEKIFSGEYKIGRILEFMSLDADASVLLANAVVGFDRDALMWDFYALSDVTAFGLERIGFQKLPYWLDKVMMPTRFQPVDYEHLTLNGGIYMRDDIKRKINSVSNKYQWYITRGDADQDRAN